MLRIAYNSINVDEKPIKTRSKSAKQTFLEEVAAVKASRLIFDKQNASKLLNEELINLHQIKSKLTELRAEKTKLCGY